MTLAEQIALTARLDAAVRAAAGDALLGVRLADLADKATWAAQLTPQASAEQRAAAQAAIDAFDPAAGDAACVNAEAARRILARFPDWKQRNMTARGVELTFKLAQGEPLTGEEAAEAADLQAAWGWIKAVRVASDGLQAMTPIPADFTDDGHWPT